ncbi:hypothetical protein ACFE04_000003 [Oxalis oulophora]
MSDFYYTPFSKITPYNYGPVDNRRFMPTNWLSSCFFSTPHSRKALRALQTDIPGPVYEILLWRLWRLVTKCKAYYHLNNCVNDECTTFRNRGNHGWLVCKGLFNELFDRIKARLVHSVEIF